MSKKKEEEEEEEEREREREEGKTCARITSRHSYYVQ
jgi:hypothetical protein